jgi:glycosyltransferase A (GT-A) superfamily protein (DUF2064 family)
MFKNQAQKTAILVFAKTAGQETRDKKIPNSLELFNELNSQILNEVKKTGVPYFHVSEELQSGNTFAERFANAIQFIFDHGYQKIITVGNDSPELKASHITTALNALADEKNALGPSKDGGFYLLGIDKSCFDKDDFLRLPWQKQNLFSTIVAYFDRLGKRVVKLNYLQDIDSVIDVTLIIQKLQKSISRQLRIIINTLFENSKTTQVLISSMIKPIKNKNFDLVRGSPY